MLRNPDLRSAIVLIGLSLLLWAPRFRGPIDLRYDAGVYYILGTSVAEGRGYRLLNEPGSIEAIQYPPLLPAIVAAHQWALGTSDPALVSQWLRGTYFLLYVLLVLATYAMARQFLSSGYAVLVASLVTLHTNTYVLSDLLFAEIPFARATTLFVLCDRRSDRPWFFLLTASLGMAAYMLRSAGLALLVAWVAEAMVKRNWKRVAVRVAVSAVPVLAWQSYIHRVTTSEEYKHPAYAYQRASYQYYNVGYAENVRLVDPFVPELGRATLACLAKRFALNVGRIPTTTGEAVSTTVGYWKWLLGDIQTKALGEVWIHLRAVYLPVIAFGCLTLAGVGVLLARREFFVPLYIAASSGLICLTPWPGQITRYLAPLAPFLTLSFVLFLASFRDYARRRGTVNWERVGTILPALVLSTVLVGQVYSALRSYKVRHDQGLIHAAEGSVSEGRLFYYGEGWASFDASLDWMRRNARPGEVAATSSPHWAYLKTGLKAVMTPMESDVVKIQLLLDSVPVTYLIIDQLDFIDITRRYAEPCVLKHPDRWKEVYASKDRKTRIYERAGEN